MIYAVHRTNSQAQFWDFRARIEAKQTRLDVVIEGIKPVLDFIDPELPEPQPCTFGDRPPNPNAIVDRCRRSLACFKEYTQGIACSAAGHALVVVRSLYPAVKVEVVDTGFARGTSDARVDELEEEASGSAIKLAEDLDLFGERENKAQ